MTGREDQQEREQPLGAVIGSTPAMMDPPSLDPRAIEQNYRRERARRRAKVEKQSAVRRSNVRFWVTLLASLAVAFVATVPVNRWMIDRGRGHAVVHEMHGHAHH